MPETGDETSRRRRPAEGRPNDPPPANTEPAAPDSKKRAERSGGLFDEPDWPQPPSPQPRWRRPPPAPWTRPGAGQAGAAAPEAIAADAGPKAGVGDAGGRPATPVTEAPAPATAPRPPAAPDAPIPEAEPVLEAALPELAVDTAAEAATGAVPEPAGDAAPEAAASAVPETAAGAIPEAAASAAPEPAADTAPEPAADAAPKAAASAVPEPGADTAPEAAAGPVPEAPATAVPEPAADTAPAAAAAVPEPAADTAGDTAPEALAEAVPQPPGAALPAEADQERQPAGLVLWDSGLPNVVTLARRDLAALLLSPAAYVVGAAAILPVSVFGYLLPVLAGEPVAMDGVFSWVAFTMVFLTPLFTMRLLAEERRSGRLEQLMASSVRFWELVVGKWLAGLLLFLSTVAFTLIYVVLLSAYQHARSPATVLGRSLSVPNVDYGAILGGYAGILLVGAAWVALGLLASSLTGHQAVAAIGGIAVLLAFWYLFGALAGSLAPPLSDLLDYASAANRARSFDQGRIVLRDVVYFVALTAGALFLTTKVVESRWWR